MCDLNVALKTASGCQAPQQRRERHEEELREAIRLTVFEKSFLPSNHRQGRYSDSIIIECVYENISSRDIRAFTGRVRFDDLFGKRVFESSLTISDPVEADAKATWTGSIDYNQFRDEHRALRNASLEDLKVVWLREQVLFADGSRVGVVHD